jgi:hypothetical protein
MLKRVLSFLEGGAGGAFFLLQKEKRFPPRKALLSLLGGDFFTDLLVIDKDKYAAEQREAREELPH